MKFQVGDKVKAFGVNGTIIHIPENINSFPERIIKVQFHNCYQDLFLPDGRFELWNREPSLVLIERPKKKVTKTIERWANIHSDGLMYYHKTKEKADTVGEPFRIACVKLTGTYEVEE